MYFTGGIHKVYILQQKNAVCVFHWIEEYTTSPFAASPCLAKREPRDLQNYCSEQGACQPVSFEQREEALTSLCNSILENAVVSNRCRVFVNLEWNTQDWRLYTWTTDWRGTFIIIAHNSQWVVRSDTSCWWKDCRDLITFSIFDFSIFQRSQERW